MPDYTVSTSVFATTKVVGFHRWLEAPDEVKYLGVLHRHLFGICVELPVGHSDRQIEFHMLKRQVDALVYMIAGPSSAYMDGTGEVDFGNRSCEDIARQIIEGLREYHYPDLPWYRVTVDEDGENGATVEYRT